MDNAHVGGNRGSFAERREIFGTPESFEQAFEMENRGASGETKRNLGGAATSEVVQEIFEGQEIGEQQAEPVFDIPDTPGMTPAIEIKPLAADGTTEGKTGRVAVSLSGEKVDIESLELLNREAEKLANTPFELDNLKNRALAESLRNSFGRMIGNDDIGEIQAEAKRGESK